MDLQRFIDAQQSTYQQALKEIKNGKKQSHWMWFIFPQLKGLGSSSTANYYGIKDLKEAKNYLSHPVLGERLVAITACLLQLKHRSANEIFGYPDDLKLRSSMTLFSSVADAPPVFMQVIKTYFGGTSDIRTLELL